MNVAVNNDRRAYPWVDVSYAAPENPPTYLVDGNYWYHTSPPNRWTTIGSPNARDTVTLDFGVERRIDEVKLYVLDDGADSSVRAPARYDVELWRSGRWTPAGGRRTPDRPEGHRANTVSFAPTTTSRVRIVLTPAHGLAVGLSELEVWGPRQALAPPARPPRDLAFNATGTGYPRASASFTSPYDRVEQVNDMRAAFTRYSRNRWTAYGSRNSTDWVEIDFGTPKLVRSLELYLWGDGTGVKPPRSYAVQFWSGTEWREAHVRSRAPERPATSARNLVTIEPVRTSRVRVVFEHDLPAASGMTELIVR